MKFKNREEVGKKLVTKLKRFKNKPNTIVLGIPRGGLVIAADIAQGLELPLYALISKKIRSPHNRELGIGAIAQGNKVLLNEKVIALYSLTRDQATQATQETGEKVEMALETFKKFLPTKSLEKKHIILVDQGTLSGYTLMAALAYLQTLNVAEITLALPVMSQEIQKRLEDKVSEIICLEVVEKITALSDYYKTFEELTDEDVITFLKQKP